MRFVDHVVPVGADNKEVSDFRFHGKRSDEAHAGGIRPLQVIRKNDDRMRLGGADLEKFFEYVVDPVMGDLHPYGRKVGLRAEDVFKIRNEIGNQPAVWPHSLKNAGFPDIDLRIGLTKHFLGQVCKRLGNRVIGDVVFVLFGFAANEIGLFGGNGFLDFVDQGGLSDSGPARHQKNLIAAACGTVKGGQ